MTSDISDEETLPQKRQRRKTQDAEFGLMKRELLKKLRVKHSERKLIVSNIPLDSDASEVQQLFGIAITTLRQEEDPLVSVELSTEKTHAVLEFKTKESFSVCLQLDGIELRGRRLKVTKYMAYLHQRIVEMKRAIRDKEKKDRETAAIFSTNIFPNHDNRVFMGSLPTNMPEEDIRAMVESFGKLKSFSLVRSGGSSRGFCFFEYWDGRVTDKAIEQLNNLEVGDKRLKVQRATPNPQGSTPALPAPGGNKKFSEPLFKGAPGGLLSSLNALQLQQVQTWLAVPVHALTPSRCILLINLLTPQDLFEEEDFQDVHTDIWQECQNFGAVEEVVVPRPNPLSLDVYPNVGKVYVKFFDFVAAKRAKRTLAGRTFGSRTVCVSFYPEADFNNGIFE
jgi:splicing factor U2AF subunit